MLNSSNCCAGDSVIKDLEDQLAELRAAHEKLMKEREAGLYKVSTALQWMPLTKWPTLNSCWKFTHTRHNSMCDLRQGAEDVELLFLSQNELLRVNVMN